MSERKVLNKYYPPDFDPSKIPRLRLSKNRQYTVRIMTPCNMRCNTCGDYISKAKKFNARKETVESEEYLGLKIFRFYFKCPKCMAEITFKTDPKTCDYELEHGATRNFQALRLAEQQAEKEAKEKEEDEKLNPMKMLENRTKASRKEMEELESLEELRDISSRQVFVNHEEIIAKNKLETQMHYEKLKQISEEKEKEDDEALIKSMLSNKVEQPNDSGNDSDDDDDIIKSTGPKFFQKKATPTDLLTPTTSVNTNKCSLKRKFNSLVKVKAKKFEDESKSITNQPVNEVKTSLSLITAYSDSDEESN